MLPPPLQQLADRYNEIVAQFNAGHTSEADALAVLAHTSTTDGAGSVWTINPAGQFLRAATPGDDPVVTDPAQFIDPTAPKPPTPAFPAPATLPQPAFTTQPPVALPDQGLLTTPPLDTAPGPVGQVLPQPAAIAADPAPERQRPQLKAPAFLGSLGHWLRNNIAFAAILALGLAVVVAVLVVPGLRGETGTPMPTDTTQPTPTMPGEEMPTDPPTVAATTPSTLDAANVTTVLSTGTPDQVRDLIHADLDDVTLLRTQALWAGLAQQEVTITPGTAAPAEAGTATQTWTLTRPDAAEPTTEVAITWIAVDGTWKLTEAPTF